MKNKLLVTFVPAIFLLSGCFGTTGDHTDVAESSPVLRSQDQATTELAVVARQGQKTERSQLSGPFSHKSIPQPRVMAITPSRPLFENTHHENYEHRDDNPVLKVSETPLSTFSVDVDTAAYSNVRRWLNAGNMPPGDAVRVEELINYFDYADAIPPNRDAPFALYTEIGPTPWNKNTKLLRIGLKAWQDQQQRPASNLVFLLDVSGSMHSADKLPLLKRSLRLLSQQLTAEDKVTMVVYAGASGVVLEPTSGDKKGTILAALDGLRAGGSTNGSSGITLAYEKATEAFIEGGVNRVILATDGDFNVGTTNHHALMGLIKRQREKGISLTTLGFGSGNYNDHLMEQLADQGNGNAAYIDSLQEARKVLVDELGATLHTVASDVKIQIEFNPAVVAEYRLIGYENRLLKREDFNNDKVDAGDIGAGHSVTALYEIALLNDHGNRVDDLRYQGKKPVASHKHSGHELAFLKLRYKPEGEENSRLLEQPITVAKMKQQLAETSHHYRFAAAVAAFAQRLKDDRFLNDFDYQAIHDLASTSRGLDAWGYRGGFLELIRMAAALEGKEVRKLAGL